MSRTSSARRKSIMFHSTPSEYHEKCAPKNQGQTQMAPPQPAANKGTPAKLDFGSVKDPVSQDQLWRQYVNSENRKVVEWQDNWGFMAEYDEKGQKKTKAELPDQVSMYSKNVPSTHTGSYGSRLNTELGAAMQSLEFKFYSGNRKKKTGDDLICD